MIKYENDRLEEKSTFVYIDGNEITMTEPIENCDDFLLALTEFMGKQKRFVKVPHYPHEGFKHSDPHDYYEKD